MTINAIKNVNEKLSFIFICACILKENYLYQAVSIQKLSQYYLRDIITTVDVFVNEEFPQHYMYN